MEPIVSRPCSLVLVLCVVAACTSSPRVPPERAAAQPATAPVAAPATEPQAARATEPVKPPAALQPEPQKPEAAAPRQAAVPPKAGPVTPAPGKAAPVASATAKAADQPVSRSAPPLDLASLEQKLRQTDAIGVMTKLSIKNQVDDLVAKFQAYHEGRRPPTLQQLRSPYELLLMKLMSLLQDKDAPLAKALHDSREAIWGVLSDRDKFRQRS